MSEPVLAVVVPCYDEGEVLPETGWASTVVPLFFLSGKQLLSLGAIGEYIAKIFMETKRRPIYFVEQVARARDDEAAGRWTAAPFAPRGSLIESTSRVPAALRHVVVARKVLHEGASTEGVEHDLQIRINHRDVQKPLFPVCSGRFDTVGPLLVCKNHRRMTVGRAFGTGPRRRHEAASRLCMQLQSALGFVSTVSAAALVVPRARALSA